MALMMVRREAGPCESQPKVLKGELENNPGILRDLVGNWHSDSQKKVKLTLSPGKKKKVTPTLIIPERQFNFVYVHLFPVQHHHSK